MQQTEPARAAPAARCRQHVKRLLQRAHTELHCGCAASHVWPCMQLSATTFQCAPTLRAA